MSDKGLLLIISGPSGAGKTTIAHEVEKRMGALFSVSATTRPQTPADRNGIDYHFVDRAAFDRMRDAGELLEWAEVFGNCYGTPRKPVEQALAQGKVMILEIDVQGAEQVKGNLPDAFAVFILPPSEDELLQRLRNRRREDEATIQRRFAKAKIEIARAKTGKTYDRFVVNANLADAIDETMDHIRKEQRRRAER